MHVERTDQAPVGIDHMVVDPYIGPLAPTSDWNTLPGMIPPLRAFMPLGQFTLTDSLALAAMTFV
jgi:hypothetical protein